MIANDWYLPTNLIRLSLKNLLDYDTNIQTSQITATQWARSAEGTGAGGCLSGLWIDS